MYNRDLTTSIAKKKRNERKQTTVVDVLFTRRRRRKQRKIKVGALWGSEVRFDVGFGEGISGIMREVELISEF